MFTQSLPAGSNGIPSDSLLGNLSLTASAAGLLSDLDQLYMVPFDLLILVLQDALIGRPEDKHADKNQE